MTTQADLFSILFFMMLTTYGIIGAFAFSLNPKASLNRVFFLVCLSLCIWAFSFSMGNSADIYEKAIFWRRIGSLGWGVMYSLLLHFFLILTERDFFLKLKKTYVFLYLPSIFNIIFYGVYGPVAITQYNLLHIESGWINASVGGLGDLIFNAYYILFSLFGLFLVLSWKGISKDTNRRKTAMIVSITFAMGIVFGTLTDILINQYFDFNTPQLGVVFAIIPISGILYSIKRHGLMISYEKKYNKEEILSLDKRNEFYNYLSITIISGSILNIGHYFNYTVEIELVLLMSVILLVFGLFIKLIPFISISNFKQDGILFLALSILIVFILWRFLLEYGNNIVWPIPMIFLLITAVFKQRKFFVIILTITLFIHFWSWWKAPVVEVTVNNLNYFSHMTMYMLVALLVIYINRTYSQRLYSHEKQAELQEKISEISSSFISVNMDNIDNKIEDMLMQSGMLFHTDHAYLVRYSEDMSEAYYTHKWCAESVQSITKDFETLSVKTFFWWSQQIIQNYIVSVSDIEKLPSEALQDKQILKEQGIKSLISIPIVSHNKVIGFLGFDTIKSQKTWETEHQDALRIIANIVSDAIDKVETEKKIKFMAYNDALTGLSNRTYFNFQLDKMIEIAHRKDKLIGILFLDLDEFKSINDTLGHDSGDKLLVEVAERLSNTIRKSDTVCRFGGDEFLVMIPLMNNPNQIKVITEKIMKIFENSILIKEQDFYIKASCGVAVYPTDGLDSETLIKSADLAMYASKDTGKNRFTFCTPIMKETAKEKMQLSNDLYKALERKELMLYYQPQININSGKIIGLEALIRWNHPVRGIISPLDFIPMAEQTGLIHEIGEWVIRTASLQNKDWQDKGYQPIVIAVNLSVEQFRGNKLVEIVYHALIESGLEPKYLELEITESIAIKEPTYIIEILHQLKALGISISIDDFGTEYSSLSRLKELPIDRIKMAMEFVQGIDKGTKDEAIAMVIINLAKSLGLRVIAEGVEKIGQLDFLTKGICDEVQGFYFHRPMPADEIEQALLKNPEIIMKCVFT